MTQNIDKFYKKSFLHEKTRSLNIKNADFLNLKTYNKLTSWDSPKNINLQD